MNQDYWQQQTTEPLFPNLLWSRPETKQGAGKLLIIGGQAQEFIHVAECFGVAEQAGAGSVRVFMPDSTRKITKMLPNIEYAPSNASGSFGRIALAELLEAAQWSDGVLLAGDLGKNSETSLLLESFIHKYPGLLIISQEALPSISLTAFDLFKRPETVAIINRNQLQKYGIALELKRPITSSVGALELATILHDLSQQYPLKLLVIDHDTTWITSSGRVVSTSVLGGNHQSSSVSSYSAAAAVWSMQNAAQLFEALTTAVYGMGKKGDK